MQSHDRHDAAINKPGTYKPKKAISHQINVRQVAAQESEPVFHSQDNVGIKLNVLILA